MTNNESILEKLRENNPFSSYNSPFPWDNHNPDLAQLSRRTSEEIEHLIRQKRREPSTPLAGLILGEVGSGKTHMLMRILNKLREHEHPAIFIMVRIMRDPKTMTQDLLSEIFQSLRHIHKNGYTQFDVIIQEVMNAYDERRRNDGYADISKIDKRVYLSRDMPRLDRDFLKCILMYAGTEDESLKHYILEWLEHGLDDEDSKRLGLPVKNMDEMSDEKRESIAEKVLISLSLILGYANIPMIICFDQIEIRERSLIEAWGDLIALIMNYMQAALPICFIRPDTWSEYFVPVLDSSIIQRIESNRMTMENCSEQYALQLIRDRIKNAFGKDWEEIYQWLVMKIRSSLKPNMSPRLIIQTANRIIMSDETGNPEAETQKTFSSAYEEEYKRVQSEPHNWPPKAENLALSLSLWLEAHEEFTLSKGTDKYIRVMGEYNGHKYAFVILTAKGHSTVSAGLRHGMEFMREYTDGYCWYITEDKTHKRTWKQANENLAKFKDAGGNVIILSKDTRINWYALTALINRTDNGDVNLYLSSGARTASREDLRKFVRGLKLIPGIFKERQENVISSLERKTSIEPDVLGMNLKSIVNSSPMHMITVEKATEFLLRKKNISITRNELISFLKNNAHVFRTFNSNNDMLISLIRN